MKRTPMVTATATRRELLLAGGGHAHVSVIRRFAMRPVPGVHLTLLSRDLHTPYSGMLPGLVAGHYTHADCHIDLARLCAVSGVRLVHGSLCGIDLDERSVEVPGRGLLRWDLLSLNTGSRPALDTIPGADLHGVAVKPISLFLESWSRVEDALAGQNGPGRIVVVGGGAAAVEIALAIAWRLQCKGFPSGQPAISLACAGARLLEGHNGRARRLMEARLAAHNINVLLSARVARARAGQLELADGRALACDLPLWAIHAGAPAWPKASGLDCDAAGFIKVDHTLRSVSHAHVFAAGDIASLPEPVPKSGVYAVREGAVLAENLARSLAGSPLRTYRPQRRFLSLMATGGRHAVASRGAFCASGDWVWRWKDRIDRKFMDMFRPEPLAPQQLLAEDGFRCGGCAAKVDAETLSAVLAGFGESHHGGVPHGVSSAEDAAVIDPPPGQMLVQSVDYFRSFIDDPWLLGRIGTVHALGDLHAMGATPHSALAIATVPHAAPHIVRDTLEQLMAGARSALAAESVALAGGHSSEGAELGFGLSVNGFVAKEQLLLKSGLRGGQVLILTKPLGSGVLFAAHMAGAADGRWISAALESMQQGHAEAMRILRRHAVSACTDITGFGLLGHLGEMLRASSTGARLDPENIPCLPGARDCLAAGYRSSLHVANTTALASVEGLETLDDVTRALLVDPQTAGGLLAAVPAAHATHCLAELADAGYTAARVAHVDSHCPAGKVRVCSGPTPEPPPSFP